MNNSSSNDETMIIHDRSRKKKNYRKYNFQLKYSSHHTHAKILHPH